LKSVHSRSTPGFSLIKVEIKGEYWSDRLPQVWDKLRRKVVDVQGKLPQGANPSQVVDDFGAVYGLMVGVIGDGYSYTEIENYVKVLQKEVSLIEGVARVGLWGKQQAAIFIDVSEAKLASLGLSTSTLNSLLSNQNLVIDAGHIESDTYRLNIRPTGSFKTPADIGNLLIHGQSRDNSSEFIRVSDIATITEGYVTPAETLMRLDGEDAIVLSISPLNGSNVVEMGERVTAKLEQLKERLPVGIELMPIHWQPTAVDDSVKAFLINFVEAVAIVLVILTLAMGWKMGIVIGTALTLTILATFVLMAVFGIDLHRMSLGALIIALGMMVDNAIVVAEGYVVKIQKGLNKEQAAVEAATGPSMALLGATIIAVMAFYPIFSSVEGAGEYCRVLFIVVAISLLVSWVISITVTPLQCMYMLHAEKKEDDTEGKLLSNFRALLNFSLKRRLLTVVSMLVLLAVAMGTFGNVKQIFFPSSSMTKFMVDYWGPEGSRIQSTSTGVKPIESYLLEDDRVESVSTFIGQGPPRFYLPVEPESTNPAYGQLIINVHNLEELNNVTNDLNTWLVNNIPNAMTRIRKYSVGPALTWDFEARFSGPSDADPAVLRDIAEQAMEILRRSPIAKEVSTDWRQQVLDIVPEYSQINGRRTGISRSDIANTTKRFYDGMTVGTYRNGDELLPIVIRESIGDRNINNLDTLQIEPVNQTISVPLAQVVEGIDTEWTNPIIWRYDRHRAITVQATPVQGVTAATLRASVINEFNNIQLPEGYKLTWFGEFKSTVDSQMSLIPGVIPAVAIILFILVALFNEVKPMIIIMLLIPFVMIGVSVGLQSSGAAFGFVTLLGVMSLAGMMIKNSIVLVDQINVEKAEGKPPHQAIIDATISRIRPVFLAAATTVLGVIPLVTDLFWQGLAVAIMAGLSFGTLLTMVLLPVFYSLFYKTKHA
ncbi:MAG: efflux RND transporter permease subunit, partial [Colwellia sp.]|nr:efflux RND transporter permease subunit [Colwellia sp.]